MPNWRRSALNLNRAVRRRDHPRSWPVPGSSTRPEPRAGSAGKSASAGSLRPPRSIGARPDTLRVARDNSDTGPSSLFPSPAKCLGKMRTLLRGQSDALRLDSSNLFARPIFVDGKQEDDVENHHDGQHGKDAAVAETVDQ